MDLNQQSPMQQNPILQQPVNQISSPRSKWKLILLAIILLLVVGSGAYYLGAKQNKLIMQNQQKSVIPTITQSIPTSTPDPTANWKTYVDQNNTFSIKYPANWYVYEYKQGGGTSISDLPGDVAQNNSLKGHTSIIISDLLSSSPIFKDSSSKQFSVNSYTGLRRNQSSSPGSGEVVDLYNPNGGNNVEITKNIDDNNMFDQILSTFKFINQTPKVYIGKDFTFTYPNNWLTDNAQVYDPLTAYKGSNGGNTILYRGQLWFSEYPTEQSLDQYIDQYYGNQQGFKSKNITLNKLQAESFYNPVGEGTAGWYVGFSNGKNIVLFGPEEQDITQDPTLKTIVDSFIFTK
jgi:hypothetical protein